MHTSSSMQGLLKEKLYREFLSRFWACNERDGFPIQVREFDQVMGMMKIDLRLDQSSLVGVPEQKQCIDVLPSTG